MERVIYIALNYIIIILMVVLASLEKVLEMASFCFILFFGRRFLDNYLVKLYANNNPPKLLFKNDAKVSEKLSGISNREHTRRIILLFKRSYKFLIP